MSRVTARKSSDGDRATEPSPPPAGEQTNNRRRRLLEVATEEFAEKGFAGARVDVIARRAAVNKQLVYYYFDSKLGLYNAVLGHMIDSARPVFQAKFSRDVFTGRLDEAARSGRRPVGERWYRLLAWEALEGRGREIVREEERREAWNVRVTELEESIRDGEVDDCFDPRMLALAILAIQVLPRMLPQVTKMITGLMPGDKEFEEAQRRLLGQLAEHLRPDPR